MKPPADLHLYRLSLNNQVELLEDAGREPEEQVKPS